MTANILQTEGKTPVNLEIETLVRANGFHSIAGVDEAGCGPLAGPVVAAAVIFSPTFYQSEVKDSKKLSPSKREELYTILTSNALAWATGMVSQGEIDRMNIRNATFNAMRKALGSLKIKPDYILFDGYELPERIFPQEAIINGDEHSFTIAAASIIAKVSRDRLMVQYHTRYPLYGFDRHKGYGTRYHSQMIREHGPCPLHRRTFLHKILRSS